MITNNKSVIENVKQQNKAEKNIWQNKNCGKNLYGVFSVDS